MFSFVWINCLESSALRSGPTDELIASMAVGQQRMLSERDQTSIEWTGIRVGYSQTAVRL